MNGRSKSRTDCSICDSMSMGMDVHKNCLQVAVLDENGKVLNNYRVDNNLSKIVNSSIVILNYNRMN